VNRILTVYLDTCCYSRLFDGKKSLTITAEAARIRYIIRNRRTSNYRIIGSLAVVTEISQNPKKNRKYIERLYNIVKSGEAQISAQSAKRAAELETIGLKPMDARHLAAAEAARADYLLTVDKDFLRICSKSNITAVKVINPIDF